MTRFNMIRDVHIVNPNDNMHSSHAQDARMTSTGRRLCVTASLVVAARARAVGSALVAG